jgi:oxygen tolerance protein BatD
MFVLAASAFASELTVDSRRVQSNDLVTITLSLDDSFATLDEVHVPTTNLVIVGEPWVSTEFAWINGKVVRRKTFQYRARPVADGAARVGPLVLRVEGETASLPAIDLEVLPDRASGSNDAEIVLRELLATRRDPLFVIAEADRQSVYVGEPVTITWFLYNAASLQRWQVIGVPKLPDFWSEELPKSDSGERVYVGDVMMQRVPIRRVALFPLRAGHLRVGGMTVQAAVLRRGRSGPFAVFEGELFETTFTSAPIDVVANAIPPGPPVDATGDLALTCAPPVQKNGGPVVVAVTLAGVGNLRAASIPRFAGPVAGRVQIEGGEVTLPREDASFGMTRRWRFLIFPSAAGTLEIPPITTRVFVPSTSERRELRCGTSFVNAVTARPLTPPPAAAAPPAAPRQWPWIAGALAIAIALRIPRIRRELVLRRAVRDVLRDATPADIRARMQERVTIDLREASDRGDAWRALLSLLDAAERERDIATGAEGEIARRVSEVLRNA